MRRAAAVLVMAMVVGACSSDSSPASTVQAEPVAQSPTVASPSSTPTPSPAPTATSVPAATSVPPTTPGPTEAAITAGEALATETLDPMLSVALPASAFVLDVAAIDEPVVLVEQSSRGSGYVERLWAIEEPFETSLQVGTLFPDEPVAPVITELVFFNGQYFAFLMGDPAADATAATILTSPDGTTWTAGPMAPMQKPALFSTSARTPPSPPFPGQSGVVAAVADEDRLVAPGWSTVNGEVVPTVWTFNGTTWFTAPISVDADYSSLYGNEIARSGSRTIVRIGGPIYAGVATMVESAAGWGLAPRAGEGAGRERVAANDLFLFRLALPDTADGAAEIHMSEDGESWVVHDLPEGDSSSWELEASSWHDPIVWQRAALDSEDPVRIWTLDRNEWSADIASGTRVVEVDRELLATQDATTLYLVDRRGP